MKKLMDELRYETVIIILHVLLSFSFVQLKFSALYPIYNNWVAIPVCNVIACIRFVITHRCMYNGVFFCTGDPYSTFHISAKITPSLTLTCSFVWHLWHHRVGEPENKHIFRRFSLAVWVYIYQNWNLCLLTKYVHLYKELEQRLVSLSKVRFILAWLLT